MFFGYIVGSNYLHHMPPVTKLMFLLIVGVLYASGNQYSIDRFLPCEGAFALSAPALPPPLSPPAPW